MNVTHTLVAMTLVGATALPAAAQAVSFPPQRLGPRAALVAAGPLAPFLFALVLFAALFVFVGQPFTPPEIGEVNPGSAAEKSGLRAGDRFVQIDGEQIERFEDNPQGSGIQQ